jgi:hypothetical protein
VDFFEFLLRLKLSSSSASAGSSLDVSAPDNR